MKLILTAKLVAVIGLPMLLMSCATTQKVTDVAHKHLKLGQKKSLVAEAQQKAATEAAREAEAKLPSKQDIQVPIGTVHMVDHIGKFILIKSSRTTALEADAQIIAYGPDARMSSHLKASPARKGAYLTADLVDGMPSVGDMVMLVKSIGGKPASGAFDPSVPAVQVLE